MWQLQTTEHTNQDNNQSILIKRGRNQRHGSDTNYCEGIPPRYMTLEAVLKISNEIGEVAQPKEFKEVDGGNFLRFRVKLDLSLPLCRGRLISLENGKQI